MEKAQTPRSIEGLDRLGDEDRAYVESLLAERNELKQKAAERDELVRGLADLHAKYIEAHESEMQLHAQLGNIYVSASQLSSTISRDEVLASLQEIVANLIGSECMGVYELIPEEEVLSLLVSVGVDEEEVAELPAELGMIGEALAGPRVIHDTDEPASRERRPRACIPLHVGSQIVGAIVLFGLLPQKQALSPHDVDLLELIGTLGGHALYCVKLQDKTKG